MKVALIPPRGLENCALRSKFHLALAIPDLMRRQMYGGMYTRMATLGDYVVLDNGLAEGCPATPEQILQYAEQIKAKEVVLPDVMKDAHATIKAVKAFLALDIELKYSFMAVVQGNTLPDFKFCVEAFAHQPFVSVIGIPRHMLETLNVKSARINLAQWITENYPERFDIHFLGTNPVWLPEVRHAVKYVPFVRSVDTSMPFSYAIAGEHLALTKKQITRPTFYFERDWVHGVDGGLLRANIRTLLDWANADASGVRTETSARKLRVVSTP